MTDAELDALPMYAVVYRTNEHCTTHGRLALGSLGTLVPTPRNQVEVRRPARCVQWHSTGEVTVPPASVLHVYGGEPNPTVTVNCNQPEENNHEI